MLTFDEARRTADHLRARTEVARAPMAGFLVLLAAAAVQAFVAKPASLPWSLGMLAGLLLGPPLVNRLLPPRNLVAYRLALVTYPLNALLLALVVFLQIAGWSFTPPEELASLGPMLPWCGAVAGIIYAVLQAPHWMRRVGLYAELVQALSHPVGEDAVAEVNLLMDQALTGEGAAFQSVPATPKNWSRFLRLDTEIHGTWHVAFAPLYALVFFEDKGRLEAVLKGQLKFVSDDVKPGEGTALCLARWNTHLLEGRIAPEDFERISSWNKPQRLES